MLNTFASIQKIVPEYEWSKILIAGDWNIDSADGDDKTSEALRIVIKQMS